MNRRIPALDPNRVVTWLNPSEVVFETHRVISPVHNDDVGVLDLTTGQVSRLAPALRPHAPKTTTTKYACRAPVCSPDGKWLLFWETLRPQACLNNVRYERWCLVERATGQAHYFPTNGAFQAAVPPAEEQMQTLHATIHWLPDSTGWLVRKRTITGTRHFSWHLSAHTMVTCQELVFPEPRPENHELTPRNSHAHLLGPTPQHRLVYARPTVAGVELTSARGLISPQANTFVPLPKGYQFSTGYDFSSTIFAFGPPVLTQANRTVAAILSPEKPTGRQFELWFLSLDGKGNHKVTTLPSDMLPDGCERRSPFAVSPDGESLLFWKGNQAFLVRRTEPVLM